MSVRHILGAFPRLDRAQLQITSPRTHTYNCIAYAAGDLTRWWWPDPLGVWYWPLGAHRVERMAAFQEAFESLGYELAATSSLEPGFERIALFSKGPAPTHAARQLANGAWSSKLGQSEDISHDLAGLEGDTYGKVALFMRRPR